MGLGLGIEIAPQLANDALLELSTVSSNLLDGGWSAFQELAGAAVERPDKPLFPVRPVLIARAHAVCKRHEHEGVEVGLV